MIFFKRLFQKEKPKEIPAIPPWSEIFEMMYDKYLYAHPYTIWSLFATKKAAFAYLTNAAFFERSVPCAWFAFPSRIIGGDSTANACKRHNFMVR